MTAGERIYNLERYYNNQIGFGGDEDTLPDRFLTEPATGPAEGHVCELDQMKVQYYKARGWGQRRGRRGQAARARDHLVAPC